MSESAAADCRRLAIGIEYDGTSYNGWQMQPHAPSIQQSLNDAISVVADEGVECVGAGRTDTGVHAAGQVAHFDTRAERSDRSWLLGINSNLPADINVCWARHVPDDFHARFSARSRSYRYVILNRPVRSALERHRSWWVRKPLDDQQMQEAAGLLVGEHDFSSFRAAACQANSPVRTISELKVWRDGDHVYTDCTANAFLQHMVRNLVGSLMKVGCGEETLDWLAGVLAARDRKVSGITAPAAGLTLTKVGYPDFALPQL
ncbi:MAG: tRNA pseudouridine(38-40) synthase TruA [Gammaproteobacteria bacterium]|nr:tRNA pseudouridine(38-40) synthase TruA [Gammaproteobacteria bacterium]NND53631.1 tRNA pseudouridine(38-40) synthase TruA [Gammaproteobacteria bacterium]